MELVGFELRKLLVGKRFAAAAILMALFTILPGVFSIVAYYVENPGGPKAVYEMYKPFEGALKENTANAIIIQERGKSHSVNNWTEGYFKYSVAFSNMRRYRYGNNDDADLLWKEDPENPYSLSGLESLMSRLSSEGKTDTYKYKSAAKQYDMMKNAGEPEFYYNTLWENLYKSLNTEGSSLFLAVIVVLILSPVFSNEYSTGMDSIILSSKNGRRKTATAKIAASVIIASMAFLVLNLIQFCIFIIPGSALGWKSPLNSCWLYWITPYKLNMLQFFFIQLAVQIAGGIALSLFTALVSSRLKTAMITLFIGMLIIFYPFLLDGMFKIKGPVYDLNAAKAIMVYDMFSRYKAYDVFGSPILYPVVNLLFLFITGASAVVITYRGYLKRDAC